MIVFVRCLEELGRSGLVSWWDGLCGCRWWMDVVGGVWMDVVGGGWMDVVGGFDGMGVGGRVGAKAHSPVDADHLTGKDGEPDIFTLERFTGKDQVVDKSCLAFVFTFL